MRNNLLIVRDLVGGYYQYINYPRKPINTIEVRLKLINCIYLG